MFTEHPLCARHNEACGDEKVMACLSGTMVRGVADIDTGHLDTWLVLQ